MDKNQIKKLDTMAQERCLYLAKYKSLLGGLAFCCHHFYHRSNISTRWWLPNLLPLTLFQHYEVHKNPIVKHAIMDKLGGQYLKDLQDRSNLIAKNIKFEDVRDYLIGLKEDYLPETPAYHFSTL